MRLSPATPPLLLATAPVSPTSRPIAPILTQFNLYSSLSIFHFAHSSFPGPIGGEDMALHDSVHRLASAHFFSGYQGFLQAGKTPL